MDAISRLPDADAAGEATGLVDCDIGYQFPR
jgi:hypothetical protein